MPISDTCGNNSATNTNDCAINSGAVYLYRRPTSGWSGTTLAETYAFYLKAPNAGREDEFGNSLSFSEDGAILVVGAALEDNGVGSLPETDTCTNDNAKLVTSNCAFNSGAVYVYDTTNIGATPIYLKSPVPEGHVGFGDNLSVSGNGAVIAISECGDCYKSAVYMYQRPVGGWFDTTITNYKPTYLKAPNLGLTGEPPKDRLMYGYSLSISGDGAVLVVGAFGDGRRTGAAYVYQRPIAGWPGTDFDNYIPIKLQAPNALRNDMFGNGVSTSRDGSVIAVIAILERSDIYSTAIISAIPAEMKGSTLKPIDDPNERNYQATNAGTIYLY
ncbi:MAG: FG-GAP repeat protein [Thiohalomonadales bacterium]